MGNIGRSRLNLSFWDLLNAAAWISCAIIAGLLIRDVIKVEMHKKGGQDGESYE